MHHKVRCSFVTLEMKGQEHECKSYDTSLGLEAPAGDVIRNLLGLWKIFTHHFERPRLSDSLKSIWNYRLNFVRRMESKQMSKTSRASTPFNKARFHRSHAARMTAAVHPQLFNSQRSVKLNIQAAGVRDVKLSTVYWVCWVELRLRT